jgi:glycosyltransferase involved in cell wall biosynthesis
VASEPEAPAAAAGPDLAPLVDALRGSMKAAVVCLSHAWGGLEQVAANDALDTGALNLDVKVLCLEGSPMHENLAHRKEITVLPLSFRPRDYFDFKMRQEIQRLLGEGVNLFHCHQTSLLGSITPWLWGKADVAVFASRHIMNRHNKRNPFHRAIYAPLDALIVMSQTLRKNVMDTHPLRERQVKVVNLGLDFDRFNPDRVDPARQRAQWGADNDTVVVGLVGRIDPAKGQATFIKAAAGLLKHTREGEKLRFVIVGEETLGRASTHLQELKEMVAQFHLEDFVVFAGYQENIPEVMRAFDIFVMPSRQEAFGLVAIEAMAMECPIIISSGGSAAEIVGQEEFGLLMRPDDAFDLQRQLRFMLDNPMERIQMGQRAREHVKKHYDRRVRLHRTLELYERALRRRGIL